MSNSPSKYSPIELSFLSTLITSGVLDRLRQMTAAQRQSLYAMAEIAGDEDQPREDRDVALETVGMELMPK